MIRVSRAGAATVAALALTAGVPGLASAAPGTAPVTAPAAPVAGDVPYAGERLPEGWRISGTGTGRQLVWTPDEPVPIGDSRVEFHAGDRLLGVPRSDSRQSVFRLDLDTVSLDPGAELKAVASGRRLDRAGRATDGSGTGAESGSGYGTGAEAGPWAAQAARPPANPVDPGVKGRYRTTSGEYALPSVKLPGLPEKVEMKATVVGPVGATGARPVVLFLHGRHATCYKGRDETIDWPCSRGYRQVPSYRGYLHDQKLLASQGYVTVSVSANGINGQDNSQSDYGAQARSSLVRQHLARWAGWAARPSTAPAAVKRLPKRNLDKVLLVGHSRGGEGVNRAAMDTLHPAPAAVDGYRGPVRWKIKGTVLIGPTIFAQNPVPDVPSMTILPGCDGDVSDLQGQIYVDGTRQVGRGTALHSSVYLVGANHNYFNTEWTPGQAQAPAQDDFWTGGGDRDRVCSPGTATRLTARQQQKAGSTYIAAAARLFVAGDDKVRPLLDGTHRRAPSAGPAHALTHATGAHRRPAVLPTDTTRVTGGRVCHQVDENASRACLSGGSGFSSPHFAWWAMMSEPGRYAVAARWSRAGAPVKVTPDRPFSVKGSDALALRVIVPPNSTGTAFDVRVTDTNGRRAHLGRATVDGVPGTSRTTSGWARETRVTLKPALRAGLDLTRLKNLELIPRTTKGRLWLMDAWGWRPGTPTVRPTPLPRIDLGHLTVKEGDTGTRTVRVPVKVSGQGEGRVRVFLRSTLTGEPTSWTATVRPGTTGLDIPVEVNGNTRFGLDGEWVAHAKAVRGAVIGSTSGSLLVEDDDPLPRVTVTPVADRVVEGRPLTWRITLSEPTDLEHSFVSLMAQRVTRGTELSTRDVPAAWLMEHFGVEPTPVLPLSGVPYEPRIWVTVPRGEASTEVSVPTVRDTVAESEESVRLRVFTHDPEGETLPGTAHTGSVRDS
ncbi:hypothetical protein JNUCC64_22530 [Streptomyces sp. JNUCC 64]